MKGRDLLYQTLAIVGAVTAPASDPFSMGCRVPFAPRRDDCEHTKRAPATKHRKKTARQKARKAERQRRKRGR